MQQSRPYHPWTAALAAALLVMGAMTALRADDSIKASVKDPVCKVDAKTGADCHTPASRSVMLKSYLSQQEKLAETTGTTNGVKVCDQPISKAALMQKAAAPAK